LLRADGASVAICQRGSIGLARRRPKRHRERDAFNQLDNLGSLDVLSSAEVRSLERALWCSETPRSSWISGGQCRRHQRRAGDDAIVNDLDASLDVEASARVHSRRNTSCLSLNIGFAR
jgi:hypothetical protein